MTSHAPLLLGDERVEIVERNYAPPGDGQLLIRVHANALCGSDRALFLNGAKTVAGHELSGEVIEGGAATSTMPATRGVVFLMSYCGHCRNCLRGATNICLDKGGDIGFNRDGGLGPFVVVEERMFFPIDDDLPYPLATMLLDVMGTSGHALDRAQLVHPDIRSIHIAGAGPVGIGALVMARIRFGDDVPVFVSDISPWRLRFAESLGAKPLHSDQVASMPKVDAAFDASGRSSARENAISRLSAGGVLVCIGHGQELALDVSRDLIATEHAVLGSEYFPFSDLTRNLELLRTHRDEISKIITHRFDVSELQLAFQTFLGGESGKVVVTRQ
jgi:threonine dehydrogenase-like Zn-dependent dehydrogenase